MGVIEARLPEQVGTDREGDSGETAESQITNCHTICLDKGLTRASRCHSGTRAWPGAGDYHCRSFSSWCLID